MKKLPLLLLGLAIVVVFVVLGGAKVIAPHARAQAACGNGGEVCCLTGAQCGSGLVCGNNGVNGTECLQCGYSGESACEGNSCNSGFEDCSGTCVPVGGACYGGIVGGTYACSGTSCVASSTGSFTTSYCNYQCTASSVAANGPGYDCISNACVYESAGATYGSQLSCATACVPPAATTYACAGTSCVASQTGSYTTSNCNNACGIGNAGPGTGGMNIAAVAGLDPVSGATTAGTAVAGTELVISGSFAVSGDAVSIVSNPGSQTSVSSAANIISQTGTSQITVSLSGIAQGSYGVVVKSSSGTSNEVIFTVTPASSGGGLAITTVSLPAGTVGMPYSTYLTGSAVGTWSIGTGVLPAGLFLNAGGAITGTPTQAGTLTFPLTLTVGNASVSKTFTLAVNATLPPNGALSINGLTSGSFKVGDNWQLTVSGPASTAFKFCAAQNSSQNLSCTTNFGTTDTNGNWSISGSFQPADVGSWTEYVVFPSARIRRQASISMSRPRHRVAAPYRSPAALFHPAL